MDSIEKERVYRLSFAFRAFIVFFVMFFALIVTLMAAEALSGPVPNGALAFLIAWLGLVAVIIYFQLRCVVYKVVVRPNGRLIFYTALRRLETSAERIDRVWTEWWDFNRFQVKVRFDGTTVWVPTALDSLFELVTYVRDHNPKVRIDRF